MWVANGKTLSFFCHRSILIFLLFFGLNLNSDAQEIKEFSSDFKKFMSELQSFMTKDDRAKGKDITDRLKLVWDDGTIDDKQKQMIIEMCNRIIKKRYRPYPQTYAYLDATVSFFNSNRSARDFIAWDASVQNILQKKGSSQLVDYLTKSALIFSQNILNQTLTVTWKCSNNKYKFVYEDEQDPFIEFDNVDLICESKGDSIVIYQTSGVYNIVTEKWNGKGGQVFWDRTGLDRETVSATLSKYEVHCKFPKFEADSVTFSHSDYFAGTIIGRLEERIRADVNEDNASYPRFSSYEKRYLIPNVAPNVDYEGGFSFRGAKFLASGDETDRALLKFYDKDRNLFIKASANTYAFRKDRIVSDRAEISIYIRKGEDVDSIFHPGLELRYDKDKMELSLLRIGEGLIQSPYFNSYHMVDMYVEALTWKITEPFINLAMTKGASESVAKFRSDNYFRDIDFERLGGLDEIHPIIKINNFLKTLGDKNTFTGLEVARHLKLDQTMVRQMLMRFAIAGLITYNVQKDEAIVKNRFQHFVNAKRRASDYDIIEFNSVINNTNARLSLLDYNMKLFGVGRVELSDSHDVKLFPTGQEVLLKKGLDFSFDGRINAGRFTLYGKNYDFFYDRFKIDLNSVDSIKIKVVSYKVNAAGERPLVNLTSAIEDVKGELIIDQFDNKSGLKSLRQYPRLISSKDSYVYYDRRYIEKGVYPRNDFFFKIAPYQLDSLNTFKTEKLKFAGTFYSAGILPDIQENLSVMADYSLGFTRDVGLTTGIDLYGGQGKFYDQISLNNKGLRGKGRLKYLKSNAEADDFKFYPDSMNVLARRFEIEKSDDPVEYPSVKAQEVAIHWEPKRDIFKVSETTQPLVMYDDESLLRGSINLTSSGLTGEGIMDMGAAEVASELFNFKKDDYKFDQADFSLKNIETASGDTSGLAFSTKNVHGDVSFKDRQGHFISNEETSFVDFPINKFKAYMKEMTWNMDKDEVDLNTDMIKDLDLKGALFVSTRKDHDSLHFVAPKAKFVLRDKLILAEDVKYIDIADSRIFLDDGKLNVRKNAVIDELKNTTIDVPRDFTNHRIVEADVLVKTHNRFTGKGKTAYIDEDLKTQMIKLHTIGVDTANNTFARGKIEQIENFKLNSKFNYKGNVNLYADSTHIEFDGYVMLEHDCKLMKKKWMKFKSTINPQEIFIPVAAVPEDDNEGKIFNGFLFTSDSTGIYPVMVSERNRPSDYEVLKVDGFMIYDKISNEYRIGSKEKLEEMSIPGSYMSFNLNNCSAYGEGVMDLGKQMGRVKTITSGSIKYTPENEDVSMEVVWGVDFMIDKDLLTIIADKISKDASFKTIDLLEEDLKRSLGSLIEKKADRDRFFNDILSERSRARVPAEFEKTFIFTNVNFVWNKKTRSLLHDGPLGLMIVGGKFVNKTVSAKIEVQRRRGNDTFAVYIDLGDNNFYFFNYKSNQMQLFSSDNSFVTTLQGLDPKKRTQEARDGEPSFMYTVSSKRAVDRFLKKFEDSELEEEKE